MAVRSVHLLAGALLCLYFTCTAAIHHDGDFIHTSRRAQFLRKRTHWHDLIEHHCPRFGQKRIVAMPINKPGTESEEVTDYRIQLAFDGDRILTPWLTVLGKNVEGMPLVEVELRKAGDELRGVRAREHQNITHWPKHVLVHYHFADEGDVDFTNGLYVLLISCLVVFVLLSINTLAGVQSKVAQFLKDVVGTEYDPLMGPVGDGAVPAQPYIPFKGSSHVE
eukprot:gene5645-5884_t